MTTTDDGDRITRLEIAYEFIRENMATQADIARLEGRMTALEGTMATQADIARLEGRMGSLEGRMEGLEAKMEAMEARLLIRFVAVAAVMSGVIIAAQKLWP